MQLPLNCGVRGAGSCSQPGAQPPRCPGIRYKELDSFYERLTQPWRLLPPEKMEGTLDRHKQFPVPSLLHIFPQ
ncbi:hypothetical protein I79_008182 [Cricetulus griseus]|uniref:Uncharacterized protein n=1 Tax=Cricetulus griseus TaxID=10029 RepID=G3HCH2_CRIGR|nr:hypothetical protein I79_008182 [Cricetulus griseus]